MRATGLGLVRLGITDFEKVVSSCPCVVSSFFFSPICKRKLAPWPKMQSERAWVHLSTGKVILIVNCPNFGLPSEGRTRKSIDTCGSIYEQASRLFFYFFYFLFPLEPNTQYNTNTRYSISYNHASTDK